MPSDSEVVTTWYLELSTPGAHLRARAPKVPCRIEEVSPADGALNRELYIAVGSQWAWRDRLPWTLEQWQAYVASPSIGTWVCYTNEVMAGYVELSRTDQARVEIAYFGLVPECLGMGLGGHLLSFGIDAGFRMGASKLWVHTCSLDAPQALANYQARGFRVYDTQVHTVRLDAPGNS